MGLFRQVCFLALAPGLFAQAPPDAAEQTKILDAIREAALGFDRNLPDFICTQVTQRHAQRDQDSLLGIRMSNGRGGGSRSPANAKESGWEPVDAYEELLTYFGHHETYTVLKVNGKRVRPGEAPPPGLVSSGEFGSTLNGIFDPLSKADFEWKRWDILRGKPVYVFGFRISRENSSAELRAASTRITVGYHGLLFADRETKAVLRVTTEAETPVEFPLQGVRHVLDYGETAIAGVTFLVPLHGEMDSRTSSDFMQYGRLGGNSPQVTLRNEVSFRGYRKYATESVLKPE
jgi:hypothetical protein